MKVMVNFKKFINPKLLKLAHQFLARYCILINMPKNTSINELNLRKIYDQEIAESLTPCLKTNCCDGKTSWGMGSRIFKVPVGDLKGAKNKYCHNFTPTSLH